MLKYKNIYNKDDISQSAGVLFGPCGISTQYELIKTNNLIYCIRSVNDHSQELSYFDVDENQLYADILEYGKKLYEILKEELIQIDILKLNSKKPLEIIYSNSIDNHITEIEPICINFIKDYGFPISTDELIYNFDFYMYLNNNCYNIVPIIEIVRYILVIFMLHQSLIYLSDIKDKYPQIYNCLFIKVEATNIEILNVLANYVNSSNNFLNVISKYKTKILISNNNNLIPIRHTTNLFTFAFETFANCLCALSFKEWETNDTYSYITFRKCQKCLKNIFDEPNVSTTDNNIPFNRFYICEDCKKHAKKIASRKYEHSLRETYDRIKAMLPSIENPELISAIKSMKPKDEISKKELKELETKITKENGRN